MKFQRPEFLLLLPLLAIFYLLYIRERRKNSVGLGYIPFYEMSTPSYLRYLLSVPEILLYGALILSILSSAELSISSKYREVYLPGIDIMFALDISRSMAAEDFSPRNRFEVARSVIEEFTKKREADRIGLVAFAGAPLLICPLTLDRDFLLSSLKELKIGEIEDGTALGLAIAEAVTDLQESKSGKVMILLTDGVNNKGEISPLDAAGFARKAGVKIYAIGVGKRGVAKIPIEVGIGIRYIEKKVSIDEDVLTKIAELTGGKYFRAEDPRGLKEIFTEIDKLEKGKARVKISSTYRPVFRQLNLIILGILFLWLAIKAGFPEVP